MTHKQCVDLELKVTYIGGPTALVEIDGLKLLTDPTFDPAGTEYARTKKLVGPALTPDEIGHVDVVLLSHDEHSDNLDQAGRKFLDNARIVLTTQSGAKRLGGNSYGLQPWEQFTVESNAGEEITITATPARHGPAGLEPRIGDVIGFVVSWSENRDRAVYFSGDTVWYDAVAEIGKRFHIETAILNLGAVQLDAYSPERLTLSAADAVCLVEAFHSENVIPLHYEGWAHFRESREDIDRAFAQAGLSKHLHWLKPGVPQIVE